MTHRIVISDEQNSIPSFSREKIMRTSTLCLPMVRKKFLSFRTYHYDGGRTKEPILNETKSPILETEQNRRFQKGDKSADFGNETKPPISEMRQNRRFRKLDKTADFVKEQIALKIVSLMKASLPNYR